MKNEVTAALARIDERAKRVEHELEQCGPDIDTVCAYFEEHDPGFEDMSHPDHIADVVARCLKGNYGFGNATAMRKNSVELLNHLLEAKE